MMMRRMVLTLGMAILAGTAAFTRGDFAQAVVYWDRAGQIGPPDNPMAQQARAAAALRRAAAHEMTVVCAKPAPVSAGPAPSLDLRQPRPVAPVPGARRDRPTVGPLLLRAARMAPGRVAPSVPVRPVPRRLRGGLPPGVNSARRGWRTPAPRHNRPRETPPGSRAAGLPRCVGEWHGAAAVRRLGQMEAAAITGMPQPKVSQVRPYKLQNISPERLMQALVSLDQRVETVVRPARHADRAGITVAA